MFFIYLHTVDIWTHEKQSASSSLAYSGIFSVSRIVRHLLGGCDVAVASASKSASLTQLCPTVSRACESSSPAHKSSKCAFGIACYAYIYISK